MSFSLKLTVVFFFGCVYAASGKSCSFNLKDFKTEPVILAKNGDEYAYFQAESQTPEVADGSELLLVCAGKSNKLKNIKKVSLALTCKDGDFVAEDGKKYTLKDSQCSKIPTADIVDTEEKCGKDNGNIFKVGFPYLEDKFETLFTICYNKETKTLYWTHSTIHGKSLPYSISESKRKAFTADEMGETTTKINKWYTQSSQISQFGKIFGKDQTFVSKKHFIARGHCVPDADGVMRPQQWGTYFYMNAQPQFQECNAGNWLRIENIARELGIEHKTDLDVFTGVIGQLQLEDENGNLATAYVDDVEQMPVPEYFFKVVSDLKKKESIVFIASNNIWAKSVKPFCKDICAENNVSHADFPRLERGFAFCCSLSEFLKHYEYLPKSVSAKKVLSL